MEANKRQTAMTDAISIARRPATSNPMMVT